ncbi:MAG: pyruvate formate lyase family protein, partial [Clostridia bacterium]|nr:pyruvate formate lyase family protein [Clostridia bacterium]
MDRIAYLREKTFTKNREKRPFYYHFYKHYLGEADGCVGHYGKAFYHAMSAMAPIIDKGELVVGQYAEAMTPSENAEWEARIHDIALEQARIAGGGQDSHMAIDYEKLLSKGIRGILDEIAGYMATCPEEKLAFYEHVCLCLEGVLVHAGHYADLAEDMAAEESDPVRKAELIRIGATCRRVPEFPAESFYEAVQSVHFVTYCISLNPFRPHIQQFQLGHPDRYLLPYYQADLAKGAIIREEAQLLLDLLSIQMNLRVPNGLSSGYMVGGRDRNGKVVANDLTGMLMQVIDDIRLVYPSVGLCVTGDTPRNYLDQAVEILSHGRSHPAIFNDDIITKGLVSYGIPEAEAHDYIHSTCVEITPCGASNVWVASPYTNMPGILLEEMSREYPTFDALVEAVLSNLDARIRRNFENENALRAVRAKNSMNPLLSAFVKDCLAKGLDIEAGGARYNWIMPSFVGMANLVDALYALRELVFETREFTMAQMKAVVEANFEGNELLRQRILHKIPKYGNDNDDIDRLFGFFT